LIRYEKNEENHKVETYFYKKDDLDEQIEFILNKYTNYINLEKKD
jgi:hypothetical protein